MTLYKIRVGPLGVLLYILLAGGKINPELPQALRFVHSIASGGQRYRWRRDETGPGQELTAKLWDAVGDVMNFGPWDLLARFGRGGDAKLIITFHHQPAADDWGFAQPARTRQPG